MEKHPSRRASMEKLESRQLLSAAPPHPATPHHRPFDHVLIISVDGLHQADVADPLLAGDLATLLSLAHQGVSYTDAHTTSPSDSFPGTLSYLTGASPGTTGVFYDDSYSRTLRAPGSDTSAAPGTEVVYDESVDKNLNLLSGGGNFDASSIDPTKLPVDSHGHVVYPHSFLRVNTIFNVAHNAGLFTAFSDKHPSYDIANGPSGNGVDEFYSPEIAASVALLDPATNKTVNADTLEAANAFADLSKYKFVDASTDPAGASDPNLNVVTNNVLLTEKYDDLKVQAIINEINGLNPQGSKAAPVPNLFGFNFQAVSVAEKDINGGINLLPNGHEQPSALLESALKHSDASVGQIVQALQAKHLWNNTLLFVTAKHGQNPRVGVGGLMSDKTIPGVLTAAGADPAQATQDDVSLVWLKDQSKTAAGVDAINAFKKTGTIDVFFQGQKQTLPANQIINKVLSGAALQQFKLGNPLANSRTPDIVVTLKPGFIWVGNVMKFAHKRAEHGGFSADDTHVPLIVSSGDLPNFLRGNVVDNSVTTQQIATTALTALGLNPQNLQGARAEHTALLPAVQTGHGNNVGSIFGSADEHQHRKRNAATLLARKKA